MQINPRPLYPAPSALPNRPAREQMRPDAEPSPRRDAADAAPKRPAERILQGEFVDDASSGPRDRVNPWRQVDPALRPAIDAYEQMQTLSPRPGREAGSLLDRFA